MRLWPPGLTLYTIERNALKQQNRDSSVRAAEVWIFLQPWPGLQQLPSVFRCFRPILAINTTPNLAGMKQFLHPPLHGNPDISAGSSGTVPMNDFEKGMFLVPRNRNFMLQALERLLNCRPISL